MGARGRATARALSSRSRARSRRARRSVRIADPGRVLAGLGTAACGAILAACALGPYFVLRDVSVSGAHHVNAGAAAAATALADVPTFLASGARARERVMRLPAIRDARVEIALPDRARITLSERVPVGRWIAGGLEWFVDADGVLFASIDPRAAPELRITDERGARQAGDRLDPALVDAAMRLARIAPADLRPDATSARVVLTAGPNVLVLRVSAGWEIRFGGAELIDEKIANAKRFLRDNQQRKLDYVDVRTPDSIVVSPR